MSNYDNSQGHYTHRSFTRQMRRSITKMKESIQKITEFDDIEDEPLHIVPENLNTLSSQTGFTKNEIRRLYRNFKQYSPNGVLTANDLRIIYAKLFPVGDCRKYAQLIFNNLDEDGDGIVSFSNILTVMASIMKGNNDEKLYWIFRFYDLDSDGFITKQEMTIILSAIYEMIQKYRINDCINHVERFFQKMDTNKDGIISREEFLTNCKKDNEINDQLRLFEDTF